MNLNIKKKKNLFNKLPFKITLMSFSSMDMTFFQKKKKKIYFLSSQTMNFSSYNLQDQKKIQMFKQLIDSEIERHTTVMELHSHNDLDKDIITIDNFQTTKEVLYSHAFSIGLLHQLKDAFSTSGIEPRSFEFADFLDIYSSYIYSTYKQPSQFNEMLRDRPFLATLMFNTVNEIDLINLSLNQGPNPLNIYDILMKNVTVDVSEHASFMYYPDIIHLTDPVINNEEVVTNPVILNEGKEEDLTLSFVFNKDFLLTSLGLLMIMILGGAVLLRDRLMKLLILLEILFLIIIIGFTLQQELIFMTSEPINMGILFIALAACEAVLGLSIIIIRTRVLTTYLTTQTNNFIKYTKNKLKIF